MADTDDKSNDETEDDSGVQKPEVDKMRTPLRRRPLPAVGPGNEPAAALDPEDAVQGNEETVLMTFPKEVLLTDDSHKRIKFPQGLVAVPAHLADHWYLKANGAKRAAATAPVVQTVKG